MRTGDSANSARFGDLAVCRKVDRKLEGLLHLRGGGHRIMTQGVFQGVAPMVQCSASVPGATGELGKLLCRMGGPQLRILYPHRPIEAAQEVASNCEVLAFFHTT